MLGLQTTTDVYIGHECVVSILRKPQNVVFYEYSSVFQSELFNVVHVGILISSLKRRCLLCVARLVHFLRSNPRYRSTDMTAVVIYMTFQSMTAGHGTRRTSCRRRKPGSKRCVMRSGTWPCTLTCWKRRRDKVTLGNRSRDSTSRPQQAQ